MTERCRWHSCVSTPHDCLFALRFHFAVMVVCIASSGRVLVPADVLTQAKADKKMRSQVKTSKDVLNMFNLLHEKHHVVAAYGTATYNKPQQPLKWEDVSPHFDIPNVQLINRAGGQPSCPAIRLVAPDHQRWPVFLDTMKLLFPLDE